MKEIWDGYLADGTMAGLDLIRGEEIPKGLYHLASRVLLRHADGDYLVMRRDPERRLHGGKLEATAGGSALKGESAEAAAIRELYEETGFKADTLLHLGGFRTHNTLFEVFLATTDRDKNGVILQKGETVGYRWVSEDELIRIISSDESVPTDTDFYLGYFANKDLHNKEL